jgi:glucan phosphoethanolaminetransferase (alkaline phosphatase superfamily)
MLFFLSAAIVAVFQPYKVRAHNSLDSVLMILAGICFVCYFHSALSQLYSTEVGSFLLLSVSLLLLYFILLLIWKLVGARKQALLRNVRMLLSSVAHYPREQSGGEAVIEDFDRGLDASERNSYPPLLG